MNKKIEQRFTEVSSQATGNGRIPKSNDVPRKNNDPKANQDPLPIKKKK